MNAEVLSIDISGFIVETRREKENNGFKPTFDYKDQTIPLDFAPSRNILTLESQEPLLLSIVRNIESATDLTRNTIMAKINKKKELLGVEIEVAAILIAQEHNVDVAGFLREAESEILKRAKTL